ncbi:hypothetical protein F5I97DRAFT_1892899 [Phlebopus sp. FC_14]|nr:hypothetical protein F5I97DRAFT_1892899 [Phlebopus sp. FC_14]
MDPRSFNGYQTTIDPTYLHVAPSQEPQSYIQYEPDDREHNEYSSTQSPGQLLDDYHTYLRTRRGGIDLTYARELWMRQRQTIMRYPEHAGAPIGSEGLIGDWGRHDPHNVMCIPVVDAEPFPGCREIAFKGVRRRNVSGVRSVGTAMTDIKVKRWRNMQRPNDPTFDSSVGSIMLRIHWPGYTPRMYCINNSGDGGSPLKRCELAWCVADAYENYFRLIEGLGTLPAHIGHFNIALHQGPNARPDSFGIHFEQLHLVSIRNTARGDWVAEVDVV